MTLYPSLDIDLSKSYEVKVHGYSKDSTIIMIEGCKKNVQNACQDLKALIVKYSLVNIQFEHSPLLLESASRRIEENKLKVHFINADPRRGHMCLTLASFDAQQLEAAVTILKGNLIYEIFRIPDEIVVNLETMKYIVDNVSKEHQVSIDCVNRRMLHIDGFMSSDIAFAYAALLEELLGIKDFNIKICSTNHTIDSEIVDNDGNSCKANVDISGEMTYYLQNKISWLNQVTKECTFVHAPVKEVSLISSDDMECTYTYKFEGRENVIESVVKEIQSLAKAFSVQIERLLVLCENVRLMCQRWKLFREESESEYNVCMDFTITSHYCSSSILKEAKSLTIVEFIICGCNAEQITAIRQKLQLKENGSNLPIQEKVLSEEQLMKLQSLITREELWLDQRYPSALIKLVPQSRLIQIKAASTEEIESVYENLKSKLDTIIISKQPALHALLCEAHYLPLLLSCKFESITAQIKKRYGVRLYPINTCLLDSIVKQVIFRSSSNHLIAIQLCYCNLLYEQVDAIVNCCDSRELSKDLLVIGGQVLKVELEEYIANHQLESATNVSICCGSGYLPCKKIIHIFSSPEYQGVEHTLTTLRKALECAQEHKLLIISFPSTNEDSSLAKELVREIQLFFIQNPNSCVHTVRIVCSSVQLINAYNGVKEFDYKESILDLPGSQTLLTPTNHDFCQWYWQADDDIFIPYEKAMNASLTYEHEVDPKGKCYFDIGSNRYKADFAQMEQINESTNFTRVIKFEYLQQNRPTGTSSVNMNMEVNVSVTWFHHSENQDPIPYSAADSRTIEDLYFSCSKSPTLKQGSNIFSLGFKTMKKQNTTFSQVMPSKTTDLVRKVFVHQPIASRHLQFFPRWYYTDDTKRFVPYSTDNSASIEDMYQNQVHNELLIDSGMYKFDFDDMKQINCVTGHKRKTKRVLESIVPHHHSCKGLIIHVEGTENLVNATDELKGKLESMLYTKINEIQFPSTLSTLLIEYFQSRILNLLKKYNILFSISSSAVGATIESEVVTLHGEESLVHIAAKEIDEELASVIANQDNPKSAVFYLIPVEWEPQTYNAELFNLHKQTDEYDHIKSMFQSTMPTSYIVSIMRIQSIWLWERHVSTKRRMFTKNKGIVNEKELFHGSSSQAYKIYGGEEGFDMRYSAEGLWGFANYFAENASYSNSYAYQYDNGTREMFVAKVLIGNSYKCSCNSSLRMPPKKNSEAHDHFHEERYDTVEGETRGSKVYMTYSNDKAYPAYLVVYYPHYHTCPRQPTIPHDQYPHGPIKWNYPFALTSPNVTVSTSPSNLQGQLNLPPSTPAILTSQLPNPSAQSSLTSSNPVTISQQPNPPAQSPLTPPSPGMTSHQPAQSPPTSSNPTGMTSQQPNTSVRSPSTSPNLVPSSQQPYPPAQSPLTPPNPVMTTQQPNGPRKSSVCVLQ